MDFVVIWRYILCENETPCKLLSVWVPADQECFTLSILHPGQACSIQMSPLESSASDKAFSQFYLLLTDELFFSQPKTLLRFQTVNLNLRFDCPCLVNVGKEESSHFLEILVLLNIPLLNEVDLQ